MDEQKENDDSCENEGIKFIADNEMLKNYPAFNIDYVNNWLKKGFHIVAGNNNSCRG
ncbi:hypothetical protein PV797_21350 [Clostridiaceae bacterium M8S5]|nr:hypothetical protein PV797_21350 [Clostridiaceae bacterium M8S5]